MREEGGLEPAVERDLLRAGLAALVEAERWGELEARVAGLAPDPLLAADVALSLEALALAGRRYGAAKGLLERWSRSSALAGAARAEFAARATRWSDLVAELRDPAVEWRGAEELLSNLPAAVRPESEGDRRYLVCRTASIDHLPSLAGEEPGRHPYSGVAGIPVEYGGGSFRMVWDLRLRDVTWSATAAFGLLPIDALEAPTSRRTGFTITCGGGNHLVHAGLESSGAGLTLAPLLDRWLRLDYEYLASPRQARIVVADLDSREVLAAWRCGGIDAPPPGLYLLGFDSCGASPPVELDVERAVLFGGFRSRRDWDQVLAGGGDRAGAAQLGEAARTGTPGPLQALASRWRELAAIAGDDRALLERRALRLEGEAAWISSGGHPGRFAELVDPAVGPDGLAPFLTAWLLERSDEPAWIAAGALGARRTCPGRTPAQAFDERLVPHLGQADLAEAALAAWVRGQVGPAPGVEYASAVATLRALQARSADLPALDALARRFVRAHRDERLPPESLRLFQPVRLELLMHLLRHRDAVEHAGRSSVESIADAARLARRLDDEETLEVEERRREAADRSVTFPALPGE